MLFLTAFIWGVAFVAQSVGMNYIGPFTFSCVRSILGGIVLIPCIWFLDRLKMKEEGVTEKRTMSEKEKKTLLIGGICCGIALCGIQSAAVWCEIHDRRKGRFYHRIIHRAGADLWNFPEEESRSEGVDQRGNLSRGTVPALHDRETLYQQR